MMKYISFSCLLLNLLLFTACRKASKDVNDYYPEVTTVSAIVNTEGAVEVGANVTLEKGDLEYIGFCMDTIPSPNMTSNQQIVSELDGSAFKTVYNFNFVTGKTYYFRSWATSNTGYSYGNVIALTNIIATPVTAPCTLNENSSDIGTMGSGAGESNSVYKVTKVDNFSGTWDITATGYSAGAGTLRFRFGSQLKTKIFTTTYDNAYGDLVSIDVSTGFNSGRVKAGYNVYVNKLAEGIFEITVCDAQWILSGSSASFDLNARFKSPL